MRTHIQKSGGLYFATEHKDIKFIPTGSRLLDLALGGGWAQSRIANIIGDKSSGKSLLAIEAMANFNQLYLGRDKNIGYRESEHAFLPEYARALGCPLERIENWDARNNKLKHPLDTVEDLFDDLSDLIARQKAKGKNPSPFLHITDSLDALSDEEELTRDLRKGSYGTKKAKNMSALFRQLTGPLEAANITLLIISQVRSKIGPHLGRDVARTGGRALDFYASQAIYLADIGKEKRTIRGQDRIVGVNILAKVDKNKISNSYRSVEFPIRFGYGVDDVRSCLNWLRELNALKEFGFRTTDKSAITKYMDKFETMALNQRRTEISELHKIVGRNWFDIERALTPKIRKYV